MSCVPTGEVENGLVRATRGRILARAHGRDARHDHGHGSPVPGRYDPGS